MEVYKRMREGGTQLRLNCELQLASGRFIIRNNYKGFMEKRGGCRVGFVQGVRDLKMGRSGLV
jgi:hypothetical protein